MSRADRDDDRFETFDALARLLRNLAVHSPAALDGAVDDVFAWVTFLPHADRRLFIEALTRTLVGAASVESYSPVAQLLREWTATAEIHADPTLAWRLHKRIEAAGKLVAPPVS